MEINGKKVVDAKRPVRIHITPRDTTEGDNKNPSSCAAARAAKRDIPNCLSARVHVGRVYIEQQDKWVRYQTPLALRTEIVAFDKGGKFQPGEYELKEIGPAARSEARAEAHQKRKRKPSDAKEYGNSRTKQPRRVHVARIKRHEVSGIRPKGANR